MQAAGNRAVLAASLIGVMLASAAVVGAVGLALVPAGRPLAFLGLLAAVWVCACRAGWDAGLAAAMTAMVSYVWAHGRPRFQATTSDALTIRIGAVLLLAGLVLAWLGDHRHRSGRRRWSIVGSDRGAALRVRHDEAVR